MSSEFSCDYCSAGPRKPCHSRKEASTCPNQDSPGSLYDFDTRQVAEWIRYNSSWRGATVAEDGERAARFVEEKL